MYLSSSNWRLGLNEVVLHESLEVEIGKGFITWFNVEQARQLSVRVNFASILLILEVVGADVEVDFATDVGSCHLSSTGLAEKLGEFITDKSGFNEPGWFA